MDEQQKSVQIKSSRKKRTILIP